MKDDHGPVRGKAAFRRLEGIMRKAVIAGVCLSVVLCAQRGFCAGASSDDRSAETVERLQKIEIGKFYNAKDGKAPMLPMAIGFYNEAVQFYEKSEYDLARQAAQESLDLEPRNPMALELLGELENLQQHFAAAEEFYKKSYLLSPSPRVRKKIEKLQQENTVEKDLDTYDEEHFIIKYQQGEKGYEGFGLKELLRTSYRQISQDFGYYFKHKTVVLFYSGDQFREVTGQAHWVGGLYDGKIRLPSLQDNVISDNLRAVVAHEMTHAFVASISGMRAPAWLHEGLAEYEANKVRPIDKTVFDAAVRTQTLLPLAQIFSDKVPTENKDQLSIILFYQESYMLVNYMIGRYQMYRMKEILGKFKEGKSAEEAIEDVLAISPKMLEKEWLATLSKS